MQTLRLALEGLVGRMLGWPFFARKPNRCKRTVDIVIRFLKSDKIVDDRARKHKKRNRSVGIAQDHIEYS